MSTKIYDAYEFTGENKDLASVMEIMQTIKKETEENARKEIMDSMAYNIQRRLDLYHFHGEKLLDPAVTTDENLLREYNLIAVGRERLLTHYCYDDVKEYAFPGFSYAKVALFPLKDHILAMTFGNHSMIGKTFHKFFKDYHFQNQCDRPEKISAAEWKKREKDWEEALGPDYIPTRHGIFFELFNMDDTQLQADICFKNDYLDKAMKKAERDTKTRVRIIYKSVPCPLIPEDATNTQALGIMVGKEYKKWEAELNKEIEEKLGLVTPNEKELTDMG